MTDPTIPAVFDQRAHHRHMARAMAAGPADFLFREAAQGLQDRLFDLARRFSRQLHLSDLPIGLHAPGTPDVLRLAPHAGADIIARPDQLPIAEASVDLATSLLQLHWIDDLPGALIQIRRLLKPDGFFAGVMLGGETLAELRECLLLAESEIAGRAAPRVSPMADLRDVGGLMQRAGFAMPMVDQDRLTVSYRDIIALMHDLRAMGQANAVAARPRQATPRRLFARAGALYADRYARADGRLLARFELYYLTGWAPAPGQPQPLAPGSATARLGEALRRT